MSYDDYELENDESITLEEKGKVIALKEMCLANNINFEYFLDKMLKTLDNINNGIPIIKIADEVRSNMTDLIEDCKKGQN